MSSSEFQPANKHAELQRLLSKYQQQHLLHFWNELAAADQERLAAQIRAIDFSLIAQLSSSAEHTADWSNLAERAQPSAAFRLHDSAAAISAAQARASGEQALREGKVAAILVAGGQGTRLGFNHPKGMYPIGPVSQATLFQILLEKIRAVSLRYAAPVPLYVMTSRATHEETAEYFQAQNYFGLPARDVRLFCQGVMPAVDAATHRILLAGKGQLALSPDGHGGMLAALAHSGCLDDFAKRGIQYLCYFQVDNPLVTMCDPVLLGYHILARSEMSSIVISKRYPLERVGNIMQIDGRTHVIEYSDLPAEVAHLTHADGSLKFWAGSIAIHVFDAAFLDRVQRDKQALPFHTARKKVSYIDPSGTLVEPALPNALKFERFIFDLLPLAERAVVVEADPAGEFAPVKNPPGDPVDSADTCRAALLALHRRWLESAGAQVAADTAVEISPLFALDADELKTKIPPGTAINRPTYLH